MNQRLTTRRVDAFTPEEIELLRVAEQHGIVWIATGKHPRPYFEGAAALQRLGYLWPTQEGKPHDYSGTLISGSFGWKIQDEGRAALRILDAKAEAA